MATLPQDILDGAIDYLQDDVSALGRCALVCSAWLHRSRLHLFAEVTFDYSLRDSLSSPPLLTEHPPAAGLVSSALPVARARNRAAELGPLLDGNPKLTDYVRAVTVVADKKKGEAEIRWTPFVAGHVHLARFHRLCSLRLVHFAFESFSDIISTVQSLPGLECLRCENSRLLPLPLSLVQAVDATSLSISSGTATGAFEPCSTQDTSLKTVSLSIGEYMTALLEQPDNTASARALHSAQAFVRSGLLRSVTSLEIFEACTVLGWLPILETLGPQLHHVGVTLHDVPVSDEEVLPDRFNVFPSHRDTVVRVFDVLRRCRSLRTLTICYDAEDTTTIRMALTIRPGGGWLGISASIDEGPLISPYFLDEAVRLFSGASESHVAHTP
ncbi:hypothetical protein K466DRAFT_213897 [Polyporus arcularius HHB13444]|uniref:F-box domain-containing protein n=1 Tax=Polyporus arcularius HHB13444 TaxID=1314778 RepID=A0A5C3P515_9APHY|nr:hypothetical protein K466DRAFT_213897 [Polyporus arcularius HHB13444]